MKIRTSLTAALALTVTLVLTGCGTGEESQDSSTSSAESAEADANDADVMFATMMIPHHEQAIEMSDIVLAKDGVDPDVAELAQQIKQAQGPEIEQLQEWLSDWGVDPSQSDGMDHGGMDGMMSEADMADLESADGPQASRLFLEQMIEHHEGAIDMARIQIEDGQSEDAVALAQDIADTQSSEIDQMRDLLKGL